MLVLISHREDIDTSLPAAAPVEHLKILDTMKNLHHQLKGDEVEEFVLCQCLVQLGFGLVCLPYLKNVAK